MDGRPARFHQSVIRLLVVSHRWLGIGACVLFVMWFVSGLVMMYVGFPSLTAAERLGGLGAIRWDALRIAPDEALAAAGLSQFPSSFRLEMMGREPVYRIRRPAGGGVSVSAADGRVIPGIGLSLASEIARKFSSELVLRSEDGASSRPVRFVGMVERDQWIVAGRFDGHRPLYLFAIGDPAGTRIYVSPYSGEVMLDTTRRERVWNWMGSVVHWLYFSGLRANAPVWRQLVLWLSGTGIIVAITGVWLGIHRLRLRRRNGRHDLTPFRGWMAWHHIAGVVGGFFLLTWIFSGWLSMDPPVPWSSSDGVEHAAAVRVSYSGNDSARSGTALPVLAALALRDAVEAEFMWFAGRPFIVLTDRRQGTLLIDGGTGQPVRLPEPDLRTAALRLVPGARMTNWTRLEEGDSYWYLHHVARKLPVLRAQFDDPQATWVYLDPDTGRLLARVTHGDRVDRWLFSGLHRLDFRWLIAHRPAWDIVLWTLSLGGLSLSVSGVVIGWRRLRR